MTEHWYDKLTGSFEDKRRYKEIKASLKALPPSYREAGAALERYLMNLGPSDAGASLIAMLGDLADLLAQSAAAGTPIRDVVGTDPADFADAFMDNYGGGSWIRKERKRLDDAITRAAAQEENER